MLDNDNEEETMDFSEKYYKQKKENKTNEISSCRITHVILRYYNSDDYISFKLLKDGTVQVWGYYEDQVNAWDKICKHEEMIVLKNELIPLLEHLQNLYPETTVELPQKNENTDDRGVFIPEISFEYENYSVIDNEIINLLKEISQFLQFTDNLVFTEEKIHSIFEKMAEFLLRVFIQHDKSVYDKLYCDYTKYYKIGSTGCYRTLCDLKETLITKNLITNKKLGKVR